MSTATNSLIKISPPQIDSTLVHNSPDIIDPDRMMDEPPFGPAYTEAEVAQVDRVEIWETDMSHPKEFVEFRGYKDSQLIDVRQLPGY